MSNKQTTPKYTSVMLIDDSEIDNYINHKIIVGSNFAKYVNIHTSSKSALEFFLNLQRREGNISLLLPEIIFLDNDMPLMDGFQFVQEFRKLEINSVKPMQIIMLTTSTNPDDLTKAKQTGLINKYINKPLTVESLEKL